LGRLLLRQRREEDHAADDDDENDDEHYQSHGCGFCRERKALYSPLSNAVGQAS
jgi:hypothetical protein